MLSKDLIGKPVEELSKLIKNKSLSPVELTEAILNNTEANEGKINAYIEVYKDEALTDAKKAEKEINNGNYKGMYHGIPMALKDNIYFKDKVTTMSSKIH